LLFYQTLSTYVWKYLVLKLLIKNIIFDVTNVISSDEVANIWMSWIGSEWFRKLLLTTVLLIFRESHTNNVLSEYNEYIFSC